jgi:cytochrome c oxidase subunit 3
MSENVNTAIPQADLPAEEPQTILSMHPLKFIMWLIIVSVVMIFASMTSAYLVRRADGNWLQFDLPPQFWYSTGLLIFSSITMHWAYLAARKDELNQLKIAVILTTLLGAGFCVSQWMGWKELVGIGVYLIGNPSGSFVYVITGLHIFHMVSAMLFVLIILYKTFTYKVHSKNLVSIEMCTTYWHFLDLLWVYLFIFFLMNR